MKLITRIVCCVVCATLLYACSKDDNANRDELPEPLVLLEFNPNFSPINDQSLLPIPNLQWSVKNETNADKLTFEVKFGTSPSNLELVESNATAHNLQLNTLLDPETTYYWQVAFNNRDGSKTTSEIQEFTTGKLEFKDASLEQIIRDALAKPTGDFTREELASIRTIPVDTTVSDAEAQKPYGLIAKLSGLEYCSDLKRVNFMQNEFNSPLRDLSAMKNLKAIQYLNLANNTIVDLSSVADFSELKYLHLGWNNNITDISALTNLKNLTGLNLSYTHSLKDITPLRELRQLDSLSMESSYFISDISPIEDLVNLKVLRFSGGDWVTDFSFLDKLVNMKGLFINRNKHLRSIAFVENMPHLRKLDISGSAVTDISALANFTEMEFLALRKLEIRDFSVLQNMPNLKELHFDDAAIDNTILSTQEIRNMFPGIKMVINDRVFNN